jgi:hypothetical protein
MKNVEKLYADEHDITTMKSSENAKKKCAVSKTKTKPHTHLSTGEKVMMI